MNYELTKQERAVLQLLVTHYGVYPKIAETLVISDSTVKAHMTSIFQKLHANSKLHAVIIGLRQGLINLNPKQQTTAGDVSPPCAFL